MGRPTKGEEKSDPRPDWACRIIVARKAKKLSQEKLADRVAQAQSTISDWERGRSNPDFSQITRLGTVLSVNPAWLAFGDAYPREPSNSDAAAAVTVEENKGNRQFARALIGLARVLAEEGLEPDALTLVRLATKVTKATNGVSDQLQAREIIDREIERERLEFRQGLQGILKNRL